LRAEAVVTDYWRERLAEHCAGGRALPRITHMAFGDGGHVGSSARPAPANRSALYAERVRVPIVSQSRPAPTEALSIAELNAASAPPGMAFSEAGLIDADGGLVAWRTMAPKVVDAGEVYEVRIMPRF
jgi:phage-related tail fiber protein